MNHSPKNSRSQIILDYKKHLQIIGYKESSIKNFIKVVQEYHDFESENVATYYHYLKTRKHKQNPNKTLSNGTLNLHIYGLKVYFKYLERFDLLSKENASVQLLKEKVVLKTIDVLSVEEVKILFENCKIPRDKAVLACLYHLGLRASEACNLALEDLDFTTNLVFVAKSKTGYQRQIPMPKGAKIIFENYLLTRKNKSENGCFLQGLKGKLTPDGLLQIVKRNAKESTITKPVYPHLLRHSIATHLLINKMELEQVAQFLGHKSLESTERYTHLIYDL
jgi:site-specific recombinase XerD